MNKMDTDKKQSDSLGDLFKRLPKEELPASFRASMMRQIMQEAAKKKKQNERNGLFAVILASLSMLALAALAFISLGFPQITIPRINTSIFLFYLYIGVLALILLFADYKLRKKFHKEKRSDR